MYIFEISTFSLNLSHLDTYYLNDLSYTPSLTNWVVVALKSFTIFITFFLLADQIASVFGGAHLVPAASKSPLNLLLMVKIVTHDVNFSFLHKKECSFYTYLWCIEMRWIFISSTAISVSPFEIPFQLHLELELNLLDQYVNELEFELSRGLFHLNSR